MMIVPSFFICPSASYSFFDPAPLTNQHSAPSLHDRSPVLHFHHKYPRTNCASPSYPAIVHHLRSAPVFILRRCWRADCLPRSPHTPKLPSSISTQAQNKIQSAESSHPNAYHPDRLLLSAVCNRNKTR